MPVAQLDRASVSEAEGRRFDSCRARHSVVICSGALAMPFAETLRSINHRRWNPLKEEWVLVSPKRTQRPWSGAVEKSAGEKRPEYDPACYLCPGNKRAQGDTNPSYDSVFCFDNDFAALSMDKEEAKHDSLNGLIKTRSDGGRCRVVCFSPRHDLTIPQLPSSEIEKVIGTWKSEYKMLSSMPDIQHVMIFENKGQIMGCSNPHPHGQIWATAFIPNVPLREVFSQEEYYKKNGSSLFQDYVEWELKEEERIVCKNEDWVSLVPFWAVWPFETMILPRRQVGTISQLNDRERRSWAAIIKEHTIRYDNLFQTSFPYSMGVYQQPTDGQSYSGFCVHQVFFPPLLRSATVKKFMVGFELCAEAQRDITAEQAAERLRAQSTQHFAEPV